MESLQEVGQNKKDRHDSCKNPWSCRGYWLLTFSGRENSGKRREGKRVEIMQLQVRGVWSSSKIIMENKDEEGSFCVVEIGNVLHIPQSQ